MRKLSFKPRDKLSRVPANRSPQYSNVTCVCTIAWLATAAKLPSISFASHPFCSPIPGFTYPCGDFVHSVAFLVLLRVRDSVKASELSSVPLRYHSDSDNIAKMKCQLASPYTFISWQLSRGQVKRALPRAEVRCNYERQTFWKTYRPI